jgi:hypothetical protein
MPEGCLLKRFDKVAGVTASVVMNPRTRIVQEYPEAPRSGRRLDRTTPCLRMDRLPAPLRGYPSAVDT